MFASVQRNDHLAETSLADRFGLSCDETLIATARGEVPVSALQPGDTVLTRDNGLQVIRRVDIVSEQGDAAVILRKDALGKGMPYRDITLSADHRVLVAGELAALLFDASEALIEAGQLVSLAGVTQARAHRMIRLAFDHAEVVLANGCWTEVGQSTVEDTDAATPDRAGTRRGAETVSLIL